MESTSTSKCFKYLKSKSPDTEDDLISLLSKLLQADPDTDGANCEWIIDHYLANQFLLEDVSRVREDILKFKELFGEKRPLPKKGYSEMKVMIREKSGKSEKKSIAKTITKTTGITFIDCKSYFKNVKKTLPDKYQKFSPERLEELFQNIQDANPTDDFQNCIWTVEELKKGSIGEEDLPEVKNYLGKYLKLGLPLPNFYPNFPTYSNYQLVKDTVDNNVDLLFTGQEGILLIPQNKEASCYYGAQTSWCTAQRNKNNKFEKYSNKGNIYTWFDMNLKDKFQFHFEEIEFKDRDDNPISKEKFKYFRNHPVLSIIFDEGIEKIKKMDLQKIYWFKKEFYPEFEFYFTIENFKKLDPSYQLNFLEFYPNLPAPSEEILAEPYDYYLYAKNVIKGRWTKGESNILKDIASIYAYARNIIKGRWPKGEENILLLMSDYPAFDDSIDYARDIIKGRWHELEKFIMNSHPYYIYRYAKDVIKGRWLEAEDLILNSDSEYADEYKKLFKIK